MGKIIPADLPKSKKHPEQISLHKLKPSQMSEAQLVQALKQTERELKSVRHHRDRLQDLIDEFTEFLDDEEFRDLVDYAEATELDYLLTYGKI
ncbi:MAG: hypothetical protein LBC43_03160 [Bifidobacteriaceae bacterium]|jgi:hypothetical protein|nr:hypothetical protein [Bifidobacteriaceae bacterium]